jgi:hypothetical protein
VVQAVVPRWQGTRGQRLGGERGQRDLHRAAIGGPGSLIKATTSVTGPGSDRPGGCSSFHGYPAAGCVSTSLIRSTSRCIGGPHGSVDSPTCTHPARWYIPRAAERGSDARVAHSSGRLASKRWINSAPIPRSRCVGWTIHSITASLSAATTFAGPGVLARLHHFPADIVQPYAAPTIVPATGDGKVADRQNRGS